MAKPIISLLLLVVILLSSSASAQEQNRMVAIVGTDIITQYDLDKAISRLTSQILSGNPHQPRPSSQEVRKAALDVLIESMVFKQILEREKLTMSDADLDHQMAAFLERNRINEREMAAELSLRGMTLQEYREEMRQDILKRRLIERVVRSRVVISDEQVMQYYKGHAGQLVPGEIGLRAIFLPIPSDARGREQMREVAQKLYRELKGGADFVKLASEFSQGPGAANGGDLGKINLEEMLPSMRTAVEKLRPGEISQPVPLPGNYVIFQRTASRALGSAVHVGPTDEERRQIRELLEKEALDKRFRQWMQQVRSDVYVKIIEN